MWSVLLLGIILSLDNLSVWSKHLYYLTSWLECYHFWLRKAELTRQLIFWILMSSSAEFESDWAWRGPWLGSFVVGFECFVCVTSFVQAKSWLVVQRNNRRRLNTIYLKDAKAILIFCRIVVFLTHILLILKFETGCATPWLNPWILERYLGIFVLLFKVGAELSLGALNSCRIETSSDHFALALAYIVTLEAQTLALCRSPELSVQIYLSRGDLVPELATSIRVLGHKSTSVWTCSIN